MRVLALETSDRTGSVAALDDGRLLAELQLDPALRSAQSLTPTIQQLWTEVGWTPGSVELISITIGPGSFTGLRVGVTTVKMLAYVTGAAIVGVNTLAVIAAQAPMDTAAVQAVMDAQRQELFVSGFQRSGDHLVARGETKIVPADRWIASLESGEFVTGPGLKKWRGNLPPRIQIVDEKVWTPMAVTVGRIGIQLFQAGQSDNLWQLVPHYYRRSAAEEKLDTR